MFDSLRPAFHLDTAEATPRPDVVIIGDPAIHRRSIVFALVMKQAEMLAEMVFTEERACMYRLFGASEILVRLEMTGRGGELATKSTGYSFVLGRSRGRTSAGT